MSMKEKPSSPSSVKRESLQAQQHELREQYGYLCQAFDQEWAKVEQHLSPLIARPVPGTKKLVQRLPNRLRTFRKELHSRLRIFSIVAEHLLEEQHRSDMQIVAVELGKALEEIEHKSAGTSAHTK